MRKNMASSYAGHHENSMSIQGIKRKNGVNVAPEFQEREEFRPIGKGLTSNSGEPLSKTSLALETQPVGHVAVDSAQR